MRAIGPGPIPLLPARVWPRIAIPVTSASGKLARPSRSGRGREGRQGLLDRLVVELQVLECPAQVVAVRGQVEQPMTAQGSQDDLLLAGFPAPQSLLDAGRHGMGWLWGRHDALGPGEPEAGREAF